MELRVRVLIDCEDKKGLVYKISKVFYDRGLNIENNREFVDKEQGKFFMRTVVTGNFDRDELESTLKELIPNSFTVSFDTASCCFRSFAFSDSTNPSSFVILPRSLPVIFCGRFFSGFHLLVTSYR